MACKKLILKLIGVSVIFMLLLKTKIIIKHCKNLIVLEIFIFENFQYVTSLDSWKY